MQKNEGGGGWGGEVTCLVENAICVCKNPKDVHVFANTVTVNYGSGSALRNCHLINSVLRATGICI